VKVPKRTVGTGEGQQGVETVGTPEELEEEAEAAPGEEEDEAAAGGQFAAHSSAVSKVP